MSENTPRFAAIIGHSDEPEMLERCVRRHLAIGADHVFVSLNSPGGAIPAAFEGDQRVRGMPLSEFAGDDPFLYFSGALRETVAWASPDWVFFADSDEFWTPASGRIGATAGLDGADVVIVERFNAPVLRTADNRLQAPDLDRPAEQPLVRAREAIEDAYLAGDAGTPWIFGLDAPKLLVRPEAVQSVGAGGHLIVARDPALRWLMPDDLLIVHAPFTTEERFVAKVRAVRAVLEEGRARFDPRQAWHWKFWATLDDDQLRAEFRRQSFRVSAVPALQAQGVLSRGAEGLFPLLGELRDGLRGDALHEKLGRAVQNYRRPLAASPAPARASEAAETARAWTLAPHRDVADASECYFYHCMDIPGHGEVLGQWDLRGRERAYLGGVDLAGRSVLEIGTASGYLGFWMERQGADVTSFDLDENQAWDIVPFHGYDQDALVRSRKAVMRQINNSWWFARNRLRSNLKVIYGNVYGLDNVERTFDVVTVNSVLLHLRDPFHALAKAAARARDKIIVTDVAQEYFLGANSPLADRNAMHFIPAAANQSPVDTWWFLPEALVREFLLILGFPKVEITHHKQKFMPDNEWAYYTAVGTR